VEKKSGKANKTNQDGAVKIGLIETQPNGIAPKVTSGLLDDALICCYLARQFKWR